jgi:chromosome partitioning protein
LKENSPTTRFRCSNAQLNEREAYRALFAFRGTLSGLDPAQVSNLPTAIMNAKIFAAEVIERLKSSAPAKRREEEVPDGKVTRQYFR